MNQNTTTPSTNEEPQTTIQIPISRGYFVTIDREDYERVTGNGKWRWTALPTKWTVYVRRNIMRNGKQHSLYLHRFIMEPPEGMDVDHIDGNGLNCSKANMRLASRMQNSCNQRKRRDSTSGIKGVTRFKATSKWRADITVDYKQIFLGTFDTKEEAAIAYATAARLLHKEFHKLE